MSTRREREPIIPDRLPGEQELSRLYQQTPDEHPPAALDAAILAEARRATRPRLRLLKGGKSLSQLSRRWAIPMSLAAALLVTIGVVSYLRDEVGRPLMQYQPLRARLSEAEAPYPQRDEKAQQEEQKNLSKLVLPKDAAQLEEDVAQPNNEAMRPALRRQSAQSGQSSQSVQSKLSSAASEYRRENVPLPATPAPVMKQAPRAGKKLTKAKRELNPKLRPQRKSQDKLSFAEKEADTRMLGMATEEAEPSLMDALEGQRNDTNTGHRIEYADAKPEIAARSPKDWLADISQLFRAGKRREAEDSLRAFQEKYPDYTDYPDSFPEDVLERLRKR